MDPVCHTLVGAALAESGLKHRTRLGTATLLIGANLPDVDALSYVFGSPLGALAFRRGWTHGALALAVLPLLLTGLVLLWGRLVRGPAAAQAPALEPRQLLLLSAVSIVTHPTLDFLNTYGMRWLMPFVDRWYYGDALFILDPWVWIVLGAGVFLSRRGARSGARGRAGPAPFQPRPSAWGGRPLWAVGTGPAKVSLLIVAGYALLMFVSSAVERRVIVQWLDAQGARPSDVMVSPAPLNPFRRQVVIEDGDRYRFGTVDWLRRPAFRVEAQSVPKNQGAPAARAAAETEPGRAFLGWARYPFFLVETRALQYVVHIVDARYTLDPNAVFGTVTVVVPRPTTKTDEHRRAQTSEDEQVLKARLRSSQLVRARRLVGPGVIRWGC